MKKGIYLGVAVAVVIAGAVLALTGVVHPENSTVFLFGLLWLWQGTAQLFRLDPDAEAKYPRKIQIAMASTQLVFGAVWLALSLTKASDEILPILLTGLVVVVIITLLSRHTKDRG